MSESRRKTYKANKSTAVPIDALISYENNERLLYSMCRELNFDENPVRKEVITVLHFLVYLFRDTEKENKASLAGLGHLTKPIAFIIGNNN